MTTLVCEAGHRFTTPKFRIDPSGNAAGWVCPTCGTPQFRVAEDQDDEGPTTPADACEGSCTL